MRTPEQSALLIAVMLHRSGDRRARLSEKTLRLISQRERLRGAFVFSVIDVLQRDIGITMTELDSGGYGLIYTKSLEAAKVIVAKKLLPEINKKIITQKEEDSLWKEISIDDEDSDDFEDEDF